MAVEIEEVIEQLRDPARVYTIPDDEIAAKKLADLLESAAVLGVPASTIDALKTTAVKILSESVLVH